MKTILKEMLFMDEMKMNLGSKWMRRIASKLIVRYIKKQFGCNTELELDQLKISYKDGDVVINTALELRVDKKDINKILNKIDDEL